MSIALQTISGISISVAVQFLNEPQKSALGPILMGIWEGACFQYISTADPIPDILAYSLRFTLYFYLSSNLLHFALTVLWTFLGMLFSEVLSRRHWHDTVREKQKHKGSRRTRYTHVSLPNEEWSPFRTSEAGVTTQRVRGNASNLSTAAPLSPFVVISPMPLQEPVTLVRSATLTSVELEDNVPDPPNLKTTPLTRVVQPPVWPLVSEPVAPLSPISIGYSALDGVTSPAPEYTASLVINDPPIPLSAIDVVPFTFPRGPDHNDDATLVRPMLFRPAPSIAQVLDCADHPSPHPTPPQSPVFVTDDADPLQTPLEGHHSLPRILEDDPLMTPRHISGFFSDSGDDQPSGSHLPVMTTENVSAIPIPIPLPAHLSSTLPALDGAAAAAVAAGSSPSSTVVSDISVSPNLNRKADQLRQEAWQEERKRSALQTAHKNAMKKGDQGKSFMLLLDVQDSSEKIKKLHERAERRYYHARNHSEPTNLCGVTTIDVHGLLVPEAVSQTEKAFRQVLVEKRNSLRVIVGKGLHSRAGKAKLKPAIEQAMIKHGISCALDPTNSGVLILSATWTIP